MDRILYGLVGNVLLLDRQEALANDSEVAGASEIGALRDEIVRLRAELRAG